jgi:hypothetical protein
MPLDYEQFTIRTVRVDCLMWPGCEHGYKTGELSGLYGALNSDDLFESCELRATLGARFDSEHWTFDIGESRLWLRSRSFAGLPGAQRQIHMLLSETRKYLTPKRLALVLADEIYVSGVIPERKGGNVAEIVKKKMLKPLKSEQTDQLPGIVGAGIRFVGDTPEPDEYHWHLMLEPWHGEYSSLQLSAELFFPPIPDREADDLDVIDGRLETAYNFLKVNAKSFAESVLS